MCYYHESAYAECITHLSAALQDDPPNDILPDLYVASLLMRLAASDLSLGALVL